jgi:acyl transferase domain-containing protein
MSDYSESIEIAIIGMAGRFPGARNIEEFWRNLRNGVESVTFLSDESQELGTNGFKSRDANIVRASAMMEGIELFDASFFGMSPKDAELTDPQHRIFLECAWEVLENVGYDSEFYDGAIGVFGGATINTYLLNNLALNPEFINSLDPLQINIGNGGDFLTTRVSYKLNLKGPSHLVQSACSTSLAAVHIASQSLLNQECDMALAGGVSINVRNQFGYKYLEGGMASPDGHCRAFDAQAQGTIFGSGVGLVLLKRLDDALQDRDFIYAVIKGSAINNDGSAKVGYTAPSVDGQAEVIAEALANAAVPALSISYVEAHGTATPLGDPIEVRALTKAFRATTTAQQFCALGSVKSNIGHLDAAAGVASLIKTVLSLHHRKLPPSLHFTEPNPQIEFAKSPFYVNTELRDWERGRWPRRAGVSSFGVGGTNVHLILEESPAAASAFMTGPVAAVSQRRVEAAGQSSGQVQGEVWQLLPLSAKTAPALEEMSTRLATHLEQHEELSLADVAFTLQVGRRHFSHRRCALARSLPQSIKALESLDPTVVWTGHQWLDNRSVAFMFPGQGSQYIQMGRGLYQLERVFRSEVDLCAEALQAWMGIDLRSVLYPEEPQQTEEATQRLNQTWITQPALFVVEYALAKLLMSRGVRAEAMLGHSVGEFVAACLAGVFSLEEALRLVALRGQMIQRLPGGAMISVPLAEDQLRGALRDARLSLAAINGKSMSVISGPTEAVDELERSLARDGVAGRRLRTSHAFHSAMMQPIVESFTREVGKVTLKTPCIPFISNVTGTWITEEDARSADYWGQHLRRTVRFADGLNTLAEEQARILLEVGPGETLNRLAKRHLEESPNRVLLACMNQREAMEKEETLLLTTLGQLWLAGLPLGWPQFHAHQKRCRVPLPTYPFERQRYWIEPTAHMANSDRSQMSARACATDANDPSQHLEASGPAALTEAKVLPLSLHPRPQLKNIYVAPTTDNERAFAEIWQKALGLEQVGINDNFFDLGGDSVIAIQVISQLKERFSVEIPVVSMYEGLTIRSLLNLLGLEQKEKPDALQKVADGMDKAEKALRRKQLQQHQRSRRRVPGSNGSH